MYIQPLPGHNSYSQLQASHHKGLEIQPQGSPGGMCGGQGAIGFFPTSYHSTNDPNSGIIHSSI